MGFLLITCLFWLIMPPTRTRLFVRGAQFPEPARALDALLQHYAYTSFAANPRPKTGVAYEVQLPSNLTGIKASALRLRSGSLRKRGFLRYQEFQVPAGIVVHPYVERLILVYQNLGNWSSQYYPLPGNYVFLAPVLGLLAYDASNVSATNLTELDVSASLLPISIRFPNVKSVAGGSVAKCVSFDLSGLLNFSSLLSDNTCATFQEGHFSVVVEAIALPPAPVSPAPAPSRGGESGGKKKKRKSKIWIIVGSVLGGMLLLVLSGLLVMWLLKLKRRRTMHMMEEAAEAGETLHMTRVGSTKAPAATVTRTQPTIETEYVP